LESLSLRDVGAWWICGGIQPDHSTIGKFLNMHSDLLSETFFIELTREILRTLNLSPNDVAGDGTVIEAAASHYRVLKAEAARLAADEAEKNAVANPDDKVAKAKAEITRYAANVATEKQKSIEAQGKKADGVCVVPHEIEASVQPLKNRVQRPSYKPSVLADKNRLILGQHVHPTNENASLRPMLEQHSQIHGALPSRIMLDAGYHNIEALSLLVSLELDVLCPSGAADKTDNFEKTSHTGKFPKSVFGYDSRTNTYTCPSGSRLLSDTVEKNARAVPWQKTAPQQNAVAR
jgi:hypothetical protein